MSTDFLWLGGIAAALTAGWSQIRLLLRQFFSLFVVTVQLQDHLSHAVTLYCYTHGRLIHTSGIAFTGRLRNIQTLDRIQLVAWSVLGREGALYRLDKSFLWLAPSASGDQGGNPHLISLDFYPDRLSVRFLRGTLDPATLVRKSVDHYNQSRDGAEVGASRFVIRYVHGLNRKHIGHSSDELNGVAPAAKQSSGDDSLDMITLRPLNFRLEDLHVDRSRSELDCLALTEEAEYAVQEARHWKASRQWYWDHNLPWKRGWLLYGDPGNGKTALVRALAKELDLPVFVFDLVTLSNDELREKWNDMMSYSPCIALIEDVDAVFDRRKTLAGELTFDCLLNCIDGVGNAGGLFTIVTTNHIETIDPAIGGIDAEDRVTRPGRIDRVIRMDPPSQAGKLKMAKRILSEYPELWEVTVQAGESDSGTQFQERCSLVALRLYWESREREDREEAG